MLAGFKEFISRGSVVELAVAVVIGAAFGAVITSLVSDLLTPLIAAIFGSQDFSALTFTINGSEFRYGSFINALFSFVTIAAAIYFFVVLPLNELEERRRAGADPDVRDCPQCLSEIPYAARRCPNCTSEVPPATVEV